MWPASCVARFSPRFPPRGRSTPGFLSALQLAPAMCLLDFGVPFDSNRCPLCTSLYAHLTPVTGSAISLSNYRGLLVATETTLQQKFKNCPIVTVEAQHVLLQNNMNTEMFINWSTFQRQFNDSNWFLIVGNRNGTMITILMMFFAFTVNCLFYCTNVLKANLIGPPCFFFSIRL